MLYKHYIYKQNEIHFLHHHFYILDKPSQQGIC